MFVDWVGRFAGVNEVGGAGRIGGVGWVTGVSWVGGVNVFCGAGEEDEVIGDNVVGGDC